MSDLLHAADVSVIFPGGTKAVDHISLRLPRGRIIGFIGPSGAGKTTLLRAIVGRQKLTSGTITVLGLPAGSPALRTRLSYMTQERSIYPDLSVSQNLRYFAIMAGIPSSTLTAEINRLLAAFAMEPQRHQVVARLSGGQKQRVSLAAALIGNPELIVLDEPTVGLDPVLRDETWRLFHHLAAHGTSLIISSHVMDEAERCDDLVLIREGMVLAHATPRELCEQTGTKNVEDSFLHLVGASK